LICVILTGWKNAGLKTVEGLMQVNAAFDYPFILELGGWICGIGSQPLGPPKPDKANNNVPRPSTLSDQRVETGIRLSGRCQHSGRNHGYGG
jgi:hypothetical protein